MGIGEDVELRVAGHVATGSGAAHHGELPDLGDKIRSQHQHHGDIGQRADGRDHQRRRGLLEKAHEGVDCMEVLDGPFRIRKSRTSQSVGTVHMFRRHGLPHQRPGATRIDRSILAPRRLDYPARIAARVLDRNVPGDRRDAEDIDGVRQGECKEERQGVILARIAIEDDRKWFHGSRKVRLASPSCIGRNNEANRQSNKSGYQSAMTVPTRANWNYPTEIRFGAGRISELADACRSLGMTRPLLVTDPGLAGLDMVADALDSVEAAGLGTALFSGIHPNPLGSDIESGLQHLHSGSHDGIIAFGGGSAMDAGKTIAFMASQTLPMFSFEDKGDNWKRANHDAVLPVVAVPTTAGTGSEVGRAAVVIDEAKRTKRILFHPRMLPGVVIEDPGLCVGLPPSITAWTGMDALAHCLEAFSAPGFHPMADGIALEGMRLVKDWLSAAVADGTDLEARGNMLVAATMGATAFQKGLGAIHSLSHPIGALFDTHHGRTNAVVMPYVIAFNRDAITERYRDLSRYLDLGNSGIDSVMEWVLELRRTVGIEHTLAEIGVDDHLTDEVVRQGLDDPTAATNPRLLHKDNLERLFLDALEGRLD